MPRSRLFSGGVPVPLSGRPDLVLLDSRGYFAWVKNETTAETFTKASKSIQVTFFIADPPRLSFFCVSCPDIKDKPYPKIVWSVENLALLRVSLATSGHPEFFIYRAGGPGCRPSLDLLPEIGSYLATQRLYRNRIGLLPHGDGEHFVLAALGCKARPGQHKFHVFRSERRAWTEELLNPVDPHGLNKARPVLSLDKVIALGDRELGFVDLFRGILVCDVLSEPVMAQYVPLPKLLPNNQGYSFGSVVKPFRDVTCTDGLIRCVELEHLIRLKSSILDASDRDVVHDSELVMDQTKEEEEYESIGWRLITWYRARCWDYWCKESMVHVDDLGSVSLPGGVGAGKFPLKDMETSCPTLFGDDVACLMSMGEKLDQKAWVVTVDMKNKAVRELMPLDVPRPLPFSPTYIPCALSKYLSSESAAPTKHKPLQ